MKKNIDIKIKCNKCGKKQEINKESSNENMEVYELNQICKCGGKYEVIGWKRN